MRKKIIILVLLLAVIIVVSGCWKKEVKPVVGNDDEQKIEEVEEQEIEEKTTPTEEIDISDWKVYRNEEHGFEVKYPENKLELDVYPASSGLFGISFFPVIKNMHTEATTLLGSLLNINNAMLEKEGISPYESFEKQKIDIVVKRNNIKAYDLYESNNLEWLCYIPLKTKAPENVEMKICITEKPIGNFYQFWFYSDKETEKYFSKNEMDELVKSFKIVSNYK